MGRQLAIVYGVIYVVVGLLGLLQTGMGEGNLLGLFPVNGLHNLVHLVIGLAGVAVYVSGEELSLQYAKVLGVVLIVLGVIGIFSPNFFGLMPIGGWDVALHLITGALAAYVGFKAPEKASPAAPTTYES